MLAILGDEDIALYGVVGESESIYMRGLTKRFSGGGKTRTSA